MRGAPSDRELIGSLRGGDREAAEELVRRHLPGAYRAAYFMTGDREAAEDLVQDALEKALRSIDDFDTSRPFGPWLHRIVSNRAIDLRRSRKDSVPLDETRVAIRDPYAVADVSRELIAALLSLPAERRAVVVLRLVLGYTPDEVAGILELEVGTVHSRLSRGLAALREDLEVADGV